MIFVWWFVVKSLALERWMVPSCDRIESSFYKYMFYIFKSSSVEISTDQNGLILNCCNRYYRLCKQQNPTEISNSIKTNYSQIHTFVRFGCYFTKSRQYPRRLNVSSRQWTQVRSVGRRFGHRWNIYSYTINYYAVFLPSINPQINPTRNADKARTVARH